MIKINLIIFNAEEISRRDRNTAQLQEPPIIINNQNFSLQSIVQNPNQEMAKNKSKSKRKSSEKKSTKKAQNKADENPVSIDHPYSLMETVNLDIFNNPEINPQKYRII